MKTNKYYLLTYIIIGLISYFGYTLLYSSTFDLGLFCDASTECFSVTKFVITTNCIAVLLVILITNYLTKSKFLQSIILSVILLFNIIKIGSGSSIPFYIVLNFFVILFSWNLLINKNKSIYLINIVLLTGILLFEILNIFDLFYYNKAYSSIENLIYIIILFSYLLNMVFSFQKRKKINNQS